MASADYISREAAVELLSQPITMSMCLSVEECHHKIAQQRIDRYLVENIPAADVRPVVRGKWTISEHEYLDCSVCGYSFYTGFDTMREAKEYLESGYTPTFCPNCGADMREEN